MKTVLLFGAGKSATVLIDFLLHHTGTHNFHLLVADSKADLLQAKIGQHPLATGIVCSIEDEVKRIESIGRADIVISLLPPFLHRLVATDCVQLKKHLLTASYVDAEMKVMHETVKEKGLTFLCEMGLDPGIDHMSSAEMIANIHAKGGVIRSFYSHCGGLVAPESDDNPWHYKISWNPRNVVLAGKAGAQFKEKGETVALSYPQLFAEQRFVSIPGCEDLCWYPNRDSLSYARLFNLQHCDSFVRTTLRHPDFMWGWKNIIELKLTDEKIVYNTKDKPFGDFFKEHLARHDLSGWLQNRITEQAVQSQQILSNLASRMDLNEKVNESTQKGEEKTMQVSENGQLESVHLDELKTTAAATVARNLHQAKLTLSQLFYLGLNDFTTTISGDTNTAADVLQQALERKLILLPGDKDRVVMMHEIQYSLGTKNYCDKGTLIVLGENGERTAMAKTVGLPLGIAALSLLRNEIVEKGVIIPLQPQIYKPVLQQLAENGVVFQHQTVAI